jgi:hypothetical protein
MDVADLLLASTISNQPVAGSIIVSARRECVLAGVLIVNGWVPPDPHKHEPGIQCQILLFWVVEAHIYYVHAPSLSFDILDKWNINNQSSTSCVRPGHAMVFLIVFLVLVCPG